MRQILGLCFYFICAEYVHCFVNRVMPVRALGGNFAGAKTLQQDVQQDDDDENELAGTQIKDVFLISDSTGVTAQSALSRAFAQFDSCNNIFKVGASGCEVQSSVFNHVKSEEVGDMGDGREMDWGAA